MQVTRATEFREVLPISELTEVRNLLLYFPMANMDLSGCCQFCWRPSPQVLHDSSLVIWGESYSVCSDKFCDIIPKWVVL